MRVWFLIQVLQTKIVFGPFLSNDPSIVKNSDSFSKSMSHNPGDLGKLVIL